MAQEMYVLPCGTVTDNPKLAAELWSEAFYQAKDTLTSIKPAISQLVRGKPVRGLDEIMVKCDAVLELGEKFRADGEHYGR